MCLINYMEYGNKEERIDTDAFHVKNPVATETFTTIQNSPIQLFSKVYAAYLWIFSLKWYKLLFIIIAGSIIYVLAESILEHRKESRKKKKEGMQPAKNEDRKSKKLEKKKKVKFELDEQPTYPPVYDLVVKPSVYSLFRNLGIR